MELPLRLQDVTRAQLRDIQSRDYCKWLSCLATARVPDAASRIFLTRWPHSQSASIVRTSLDSMELKAAIPPASTSGADWAAPLVGIQTLVSGFAAFAHSLALLGRIPGLHLIPFRTRIPTQTQGAAWAWIAEGSPKPVSKLAFDPGVTLDMLKSSAILPFTAEFVKLEAPGTDAALRDQLAAEIVAFQDKSFLDPASMAIAGVRPKSITAGLTPTASTGNLQADVQTMLNAFFAARPGAREPVLIAGAHKAAQLRALNPGFGLPIIPTEAAGGTVVVVDGTGIYYADGGVMIDMSREATIQMNDAPDNPATATTVMQSLWQNNEVAYKVERTLNFFATPTSVAYLAA